MKTVTDTCLITIIILFSSLCINICQSTFLNDKPHAHALNILSMLVCFWVLKRKRRKLREEEKRYARVKSLLWTKTPLWARFGQPTSRP